MTPRKQAASSSLNPKPSPEPPVVVELEEAKRQFCEAVTEFVQCSPRTIGGERYFELAEDARKQIQRFSGEFNTKITKLRFALSSTAEAEDDG